MGKVVTIVKKEVREALPAVIFFLVLFHLIALTRAVALGEHGVTALRATAATIGALIVAKAILLVEALPRVRRLQGSLLARVTRKTLLFGAVVLLFKFLEELIPAVSKHGRVVAASRALLQDVAWPLFGVLSLWVLGGLFLYCLATDLIRDAGSEKVREILVGTRGGPER